MAAIGAAKTRKFTIGTAELRVGPLSYAGRLTQEHSVGLIDASSLSVEQTIVDLKGGFPQVIVDSAITEQMSTITGTLREYSRRNLGILMGQGLAYSGEGEDINDARTTLTVAAVADSQVLAIASRTGLAAANATISPITNVWGGWICVYDPNDMGLSIITRIAKMGPSSALTSAATTTSGSPNLTSIADTSGMYPGMPVSGTGIPAGTHLVSVSSTSAVMSANATASGSPTLTFGGAMDVYLDPAFPLPMAFPAGAVVAKLAPISVGNLSAVNYFTAQLVSSDRAANRPKVWNFWKCTLGTGMNLSQNSTDFASTEMQLKVIQPTLSDYANASAPLYNIRHLLGKHPSGVMGEVSDDVAFI